MAKLPDDRPIPPPVGDPNVSWLWWHFEIVLIPVLALGVIIAMAVLHG